MFWLVRIATPQQIHKIPRFISCNVSVMRIERRGRSTGCGPLQRHEHISESCETKFRSSPNSSLWGLHINFCCKSFCGWRHTRFSRRAHRRSNERLRWCVRGGARRRQCTGGGCLLSRTHGELVNLLRNALEFRLLRQETESCPALSSLYC